MAQSETNDQKIFSIILATSNCGRKVENTILSILAQKRELFELIVIDNASTDETLSYINKYRSDLTLISESDRGVYYAFNKGIDLAAGKYIYFIGAGDCLKANILEEIKDHLSGKIPTFFYGRCYFTKSNFNYGKEVTGNFFIRSNICHQGIFYHREIFNIIGKFDLKYKILADRFFNLKCFLNENIKKQYTSKIIADFEEGGLSSGIECDSAFQGDFSAFIRKEMGLRKYLAYKTAESPFPLGSFYYRSAAVFDFLNIKSRKLMYKFGHFKVAVKNKFSIKPAKNNVF